MAQQGTQQLSSGDIVQLAPKTFLIISELPLDLVVDPRHPRLEELRATARRAGARITHTFSETPHTHVLYDAGDAVWSALAHGAVRGASFVGIEWLQQVAAAGVAVDRLPEPPHVEELAVVGPSAGQPPVRVRVPLPEHAGRLLDGFAFGFSRTWRDPGLQVLLAELGAQVLGSEEEAARGAVAAAAAALVVVVADDGGGPGTLSADQLLTLILTGGAAQLREELAAVARTRRAAAAPAGRTAAAAAGAAGGPPGPQPGDSDVTQAAEEDVDGDAEVLGPQAQGHDDTGPLHRVQLGPAGGGQQQQQQQQQAVTGRGHLASSGAGAPVDGWIGISRRPEDAQPGSSHEEVHLANPGPSTTTAAAAAATDPEDAPRAKRQRTDAGILQPNNTRSLTATNPAPFAISRKLAAASLSDPPTQAPAARPFFAAAAAAAAAQNSTAAAAAAAPSVAVKTDPGDDVPWMTQHPHNRSTSTITHTANRLSNMAAKPAPPRPPAAVIKPEPSTAPRPTRSTKPRGKAAAAAAAAAEDELGVVLPGKVKQEEELPDVQDASAQVVLEVDLFAPTPEQPPGRCPRAGSTEPCFGGDAVGAGAGAGAGVAGGSSAWREQQPVATVTQGTTGPDFKQFRKQSGQLPALVVQPLPVFLVDNFHNDAEAEAFMRQEEERAVKKRKADEMFKTADVGAKRAARATKRA